MLCEDCHFYLHLLERVPSECTQILDPQGLLRPWLLKSRPLQFDPVCPSWVLVLVVVVPVVQLLLWHPQQFLWSRRRRRRYILHIVRMSLPKPVRVVVSHSHSPRIVVQHRRPVRTEPWDLVQVPRLATILWPPVWLSRIIGSLLWVVSIRNFICSVFISFPLVSWISIQ